MQDADFQQGFFDHLKPLIAPHKSLVHEISDMLNISLDSAYRRIRGEKIINLNEIRKICEYFQLSLDQLLNLNTKAILFHGKLNNSGPDRFQVWLEDMLLQLEMVNRYKEKHVYFLLKDIPPFYHFYHPELAAFKFFFWMKSILHYDELKDQVFDSSVHRYPNLYHLGLQITKLYNQIPCTEIWNPDNIQTTLRQIELYEEMGNFVRQEDSKILYQQVLEMIEHIEQQAESGLKFGMHGHPDESSGTFRLLTNQFILGDNTFMAELDGQRITYLNHSVIYFLGSFDPNLNDTMFKSLDNLIRKSTLISSVGEKERYRFFRNMKAQIGEKLNRFEIIP
ncbi:helix-turn-helix domain-containing protein [Lunatimonas salinarum]|uniref:helix-turn-helix domain-containing protein n=1 Tax=Lunatimonas salinarum TaxID=1774590 RepID=UPI001ADFEB2C|nr:helix-turn-helix domain-containing protein [Lunatimonas salinarum]